MLSDVKPRFDRLISSGKPVVWFQQSENEKQGVEDPVNGIRLWYVWDLP